MVNVRVYCVTCKKYIEIDQDPVDPNWIPAGHDGHEIKDFVIDDKAVLK